MEKYSKETFFAKVKEALETDHTITGNTQFKEINEYSSLSVLYLIVMIDELFGKTLTAKDFSETKDINDLMLKIGSDYFEL